MWAKILHVCFKDEIMKDGSDSTSECSFCHYIKIKFLLKEKIHSDIIHSFYTGNFSRLFAPQFLSYMFYNWFFSDAHLDEISFVAYLLVFRYFLDFSFKNTIPLKTPLQKRISHKKKLSGHLISPSP